MVYWNKAYRQHDLSKSTNSTKFVVHVMHSSVLYNYLYTEVTKACINLNNKFIDFFYLSIFYLFIEFTQRHIAVIGRYGNVLNIERLFLDACCHFKCTRSRSITV